MDGLASIDKLVEYFDLPAAEDVTTVNGWVMAHTDKIPEAGDSFECDGVNVTVESTESMRADKIRITLLPTEEEEENV